MVTTEAPGSNPTESQARFTQSGSLNTGGVNVCIHRGAHEIGGSCVEVEYHGSRIVLDVGKPLWAGWDEVVPLPSVPGLADGSNLSLAGVIISHPHLDHYGLIDQVDSRVPIYIGREASLLLSEAEFFSAAGVNLQPTGCLADRVPMKIGAFAVTPYLMDHSGFDSYSLLVEVGGKQLFYTGDVRGHGRKARLFEELLANPPRPIDLLLCEGTHIHTEASEGSDLAEEPARSEIDVELSLAKRMVHATGAVMVISSAQNIDRLVTVYRACKRAGRKLVTDLYTASIVNAIGRPTIPQPGFSDYRVYVPNRQRVLVKTSGRFDRIRLVRECRVFPGWLAERAAEIALLLPSSAVPELLKAGVLTNGLVAWSMWPGYLKETGGKSLVRSLRSSGIPFVFDHASGHASIADLQRLVSALEPTTVVPIHTEGANRYEKLFNGAMPLDDGEWWAISEGTCSGYE